jgi:hypothetical protein
LGYAVNKESIKFTVTTPTKNGARLKHCLQEAADDILKMMKIGKGQCSIGAKL